MFAIFKHVNKFEEESIAFQNFIKARKDKETNDQLFALKDQYLDKIDKDRFSDFYEWLTKGFKYN